LLSLFEELKRRHIFRVAVAYLAIAWMLIEVAGTVFPGFGIPDWAFRFVVIVLVLGFVPVLIFSWAYEITPEGVKREQDVLHDDVGVQQTARRLDKLTIGLIIVALAFIVADRLWLSPRLGQKPVTTAQSLNDQKQAPGAEYEFPPDSIAVLPFANRSAKPEDAFFVDGIHDDLLTFISQIGSIKTISRTSVMKYRETTKSIPEIARELDVGAVLEGGVQRAGEQVRINVQLIDARTDAHLWSRIFDRQLTATNIFAIQSEIAEEISNALRATLTPEAQERIDSVPTENLIALEAYFIGRQSMATRTVEDLAKAAENFEEAVMQDPDFALAWVGLADTYLLQQAYADLPRDEMFAKSQAAAERALQLQPRLGEAYASVAKRKDWEGDKAGAETAFKRALELNPNYAPAYQWYGEMLGDLGSRITEALELSQKAIMLDPKSAIILNDYAEVLEVAGRFEEALDYYEKTVEIEPGFAHGYVRIGELKASAYGQLDEAILALVKGFSLDPELASTAIRVGFFYLNIGDPQQALNWAERARKNAPGTTELLSVLMEIHLFNNEESSARELGEKLAEQSANPAWPLIVLANLDLKMGNTTAAYARSKQAYPGLFAEPPDINERNMWFMEDAALVFYQSGEPDKARRLLEKGLSILKLRSDTMGKGSGLLNARFHALRGDKDQAIGVLRRTIEQGQRMNLWYFFEHDSASLSLRDEPEFRAIKKEIETEMAEQLARVREWEANGHLTAIPDALINPP
jgi:TolB-like protein/Tfp pilus assembly protein PilF